VPLRQTPAYALRHYVLGEADLIVVFYTLEFGRVRSVARGARRVRSRFGSAFQPFTRSELVFFEKEGQELTRVSSCEVERSYYESLLSPEAAAIAAYFAELVIEFSVERDPNPPLFRLLGAVLSAIEEGVPLPVAARYFEVWVLQLSGFLPLISACGGCGGRLEAGRWVVPHPLEFVCRECRARMQGARWLSPAGTALLTEILKKKPADVARGAGRDRGAVRRLAAVNRLLIRGHLDRELRSLRYMDRLRRGSQRLRFQAAAAPPPGALQPAAADLPESLVADGPASSELSESVVTNGRVGSER
jgi:DNA repair protein RecO (recombination protein O)